MVNLDRSMYIPGVLTDSNGADFGNFPIKCPKIINGHLKINSFRKTFEFIQFLIGYKTDILLISGKKIDSSIPTSQFLMSGLF